MVYIAFRDSHGLSNPQSSSSMPSLMHMHVWLAPPRPCYQSWPGWRDCSLLLALLTPLPHAEHAIHTALSPFTQHSLHSHGPLTSPDTQHCTVYRLQYLCLMYYEFWIYPRVAALHTSDHVHFLT